MILCSVCFSDPTSPMTQGYNYAILILLGVTFAVLGLFAAFFMNIRKRNLKINN